MKKLKISFLHIFFLFYIFVCISYAKELEMQEFVAHAGGEIDSITYTNSQQALDYNYTKGFRFFEIDLNWTSDGKLVLIHDWKENLKKLFNKDPRIYSLKEFKDFRMVNGMTQMTLQDLTEWTKSHKDAYIITDVKSDNIKALKKISQGYPGVKKRFMPQIYKFKEYADVKNMDFGGIILTLYVMDYPDKEVIDFLRANKVSALTMWPYRVNKDFIRELKELGIFIYVHTINDINLKKQLKDSGVDGFYTDFLRPVQK